MKRRSTTAGKYLFAVLQTILAFGPLIWVFFMSFRTTDEIRKAPYTFPDVWHFEKYLEVWNNSGYKIYFANSIFVVGLAVVTIIAITTMSAYCFAKLPFKGSELLFNLVFTTIMLPAQIIIIPLFQDMVKMKLVNSLFGLAMVYVAIQMPISIYILRSFFAQIPNEMREAAKIDGCSEIKTFWKIMFPIAKPAISTILIIDFVNLWNEFLFGSIFIQDESKKTLPLGIIKFVGDVNEDLGRIAVGMMIAIIPLIILYSIFSENFIKGMTAGAVKG